MRETEDILIDWISKISWFIILISLILFLGNIVYAAETTTTLTTTIGNASPPPSPPSPVISTSSGSSGGSSSPRGGGNYTNVSELAQDDESFAEKLLGEIGTGLEPIPEEEPEPEPEPQPEPEPEAPPEPTEEEVFEAEIEEQSYEPIIVTALFLLILVLGIYISFTDYEIEKLAQQGNENLNQEKKDPGDTGDIEFPRG